MRPAAALAVLCLPLTLGAEAAARPGAITVGTAMALGNWVTAVRSHTPGRRDAAVAAVSELTFDKRRELNPGMSLFLSVLLGKSVVTSTDAAKHIVELARDARQSPGAVPFLERAAMLHSDAAMQDVVDDVRPAAPANVPPSDASASPLFSHRRLFIDRDGEILGEVIADWNWPFARSLLDLVSAKPSDDPFVGTWYHATTAFMLQKGLYGEVVTHLERAAAVLPNEARALFDRASYSEIQGLPVNQVLLSDEDILALQMQGSGRRPSRLITSHASELGIPPAEVANAAAERLYRLALRMDPFLVEARVRLARLLEVRKRPEEAAAELTTALAAKPTGAVLFYAHLFAGRAAQALGRIDEAAAHYRDAATLFPGAQSALLAQSQAALLRADVPAALDPIHRMDAPAPAAGAQDDPWWKYQLGAGRDADALLRQMWVQIH